MNIKYSFTNQSDLNVAFRKRTAVSIKRPQFKLLKDKCALFRSVISVNLIHIAPTDCWLLP